MDLGSFLSEPSLRGIPVGSSDWFRIQLDLIKTRPLTRRVYELWYSLMLDDVATAPNAPGLEVLELGSGAGFAKTVDSRVITSDVEPGASDLVIDAQRIPFGDGTLRAIMLTHVFHHIPDIRLFLKEALRTIVPGGVVSIIDVAHTPVSRFVFGRFHPEDYDSRARTWALDPARPLGGANQALTWIVLRRDLAMFEAEYPEFTIEAFEYLPWLGYLFSGGVTKRNMIPNFLAGAIARADAALKPLDHLCALHWHIRLRRSMTPAKSGPL